MKRTRFQNLRADSWLRCHRLALAFVLLMQVIAWSSAASAVTVSVSEFDLFGEVGTLLEDQLILSNDDDAAIHFSITLVDWELESDGRVLFHEPGTLERSCSSWLSVSEYAAELEPGAERHIELVARLPEDAAGTYWAALLVLVEPAHQVGDEETIGLVRQFLVRVFVTVPPTQLSGRIVDVRVGGLRPLTVDVSFANDGNVRLPRATGMILVESSAGNQLFSMNLAPLHVLPGTQVSQRVIARWPIDTPGEYLVRAIVDYGAEFLIGGQTVLRLQELVFVPIGGADSVPTDLDADGLYEDVNGDRSLTMADADLLLSFILSGAVQSNARAFDFDNDGIASQADADVLRTLVLHDPI